MGETVYLQFVDILGTEYAVVDVKELASALRNLKDKDENIRSCYYCLHLFPINLWLVPTFILPTDKYSAYALVLVAERIIDDMLSIEQFCNS